MFACECLPGGGEWGRSGRDEGGRDDVVAAPVGRGIEPVAVGLVPAEAHRRAFGEFVAPRQARCQRAAMVVAAMVAREERCRGAVTPAA